MSRRGTRWRLSESALAWEKEIQAQHQAQKAARQALSEIADAEARRLVESGAIERRIRSPLLRARIQHHRGRMAEERVVRLLNESPERPPWLLEAQRAPEDVDRLGVDVLVYTADLGTLPLQVKSSRSGAEEYPRSHPEIASIVAIVVTPVEMPDAEAWAAVMAELAQLRQRLGRPAGNSDPPAATLPGDRQR